ncbi:biliverdin-producing heme oxygenase [Altererythrobacter xixiisoli]|uniref:Biliverdin-producing heme oxygenase n=1 Tax=Croceibacterium xixiisoli TaxID=1476466 RepID=A0A6I4TXE8_9SPHN|nr:biliverdin-producing heme oxygenase [Croceibacterium xixiisoli]MXO99497.1 biliverdin-producing heme oxygenase [Croceibacterium xixiisoli]
MTDVCETSLSKRLKAQTHDTHDKLDKSIMSAASFDSVDGYVRFAEVQYLFHRDIDALYDVPALQNALPGLADRRRLALISADLTDLDRTPPDGSEEGLAFVAAEPVDLPTALGWLYVAEGSNMGAALLRKAAAKIGLSDDHGARHLAPAAEGPAAHWRAFTAALDAVALSDDEQRRAVAGAEAAFTRVQRHVDARIS